MGAQRFRLFGLAKISFSIASIGAVLSAAPLGNVPLHTALRGKKNRDFYTRVMAELIKYAPQELPD